MGNSRSSPMATVGQFNSHKCCSVEFPPRLNSSSLSSSESSYENNNNNNNRKNSFSLPADLGPLQNAKLTLAPMKQRRISRAASANRIRSRRPIPGMSGFGTKSDVLTIAEQSAIEQTWATLLAHQMGDSSRIGIGIYTKVFDLAPELKAVFGIPDSVGDLRVYAPFHRSGRLFASVIDLCVRNIHTIEPEMGPILVMYGRRHYHRENQGFRTAYLPLFAQCVVGYVLEELAEHEKSDEAETGWRRLLTYIVAKLAEGVELERQRSNASTRRKSVL